MKIGIVNVGTIGHIDHGRTTLCAALASLGHEVFEITEADLQRSHDMAELVRGLEIPEQLPICAVEHDRAKDPRRKAERKARMRELQRQAFGGR